MVLGKYYTLKENLYYKVHIGDAELFIQGANNDFYFALRRSEKLAREGVIKRIDSPPKSSDLTWNRWIVGNKSLEAGFLPIMPDRSLVLRPDKTIVIPRGNSAQFNIPIPVWLQLIVRGNDDLLVSEIPSEILSDTWFGDTISGDFCYNYNSMLYRFINNIEKSDHYAICPVVIKNGSSSDLDFQRFCLHVKYLAIFRSDGMLWTNPVTVIFRGKDQVSQVTISPNTPHGSGDDEKISGPRVEMTENVFKKSFQFLKDLTRF